MNNTQQEQSKQLELHTPAFKEHRKKVISKLVGCIGNSSFMQFDGEKCLTYGVLMDVINETERGNRFVRQTNITNPDVQL